MEFLIFDMACNEHKQRCSDFVDTLKLNTSEHVRGSYPSHFDLNQIFLMVDASIFVVTFHKERQYEVVHRVNPSGIWWEDGETSGKTNFENAILFVLKIRKEQQKLSKKDCE